MSRNSTMTRPGFTLIELLVVIAIIVLLVTILLSAGQLVRRQVRLIKCQSQLRVLAQAWHLFLDENEGGFPHGTNMEFNYGGQQGFGGRPYGADPRFPIQKPLNKVMGLDPVLGERRRIGGPRIGGEDAELFHCPSDRGSLAARPSNFEYYGTSYRTNHLLIGDYQLTWKPGDPCEGVFQKISEIQTGIRLAKSHLLLTDITETSRVILMGDSGWVEAWETDSFERIEWHDKRDKHNLAYLDGHVAFTTVVKGIHNCGEYTTIPWLELSRATCDCQQEGSWP
jgi:prepilin-type N-terminal cleavage/methylation domain-containing protein/prepilin-type processing-associated H-X9-DG protein